MSWFKRTNEQRLAASIRSSVAKAKRLWLCDDILQYAGTAKTMLSRANHAEDIARRLESGEMTYQEGLDLLEILTK